MTNLISRSAKRNQRGFTLIELLVVVAIIAILAALILAALNAAQKGARDSRRQSNINQFKTALANYYSDYQRYPDGNNVTVADNTEPCTSLAPNYVSAGCTLVDDPPDSTYFYNGSSSTFTVCAVEERDSKKAFAAGPTTTTTLGPTTSDFAANNCTGVD